MRRGPAFTRPGGGAGNDALGSGRRALLIGGAGSDALVGSRFDDTFVAGRNLLAGDLGSLLAVLGGTRKFIAADLVDDGAADVLVGSRGADAFICNFSGAGVLDYILDRRPEDVAWEL